MPALAEFQSRLTATLMDASMPHPLGAGLAVYRNTVMRGLIDALRANYPAVEKLVGAEWFDAVARAYALAHLPCEPALALYGPGFAEFLQPYCEEHDLPYLPQVAKLDCYWLEAYFAVDMPTLQASELQSYSSEQLGLLNVQLHAATRCAWLPYSAVSIWQANRAAMPSETLEISGAAEGVLITRPHSEVQVTCIDRSHWLFLQSIAQQCSLAEAAMQVLQQDDTADIAAIWSGLITAGAFASMANNFNT